MKKEITFSKKPEHIDVHAHLNMEAFETDFDEVAKRALENNTWVINVGTNLETSKKAVEIAEKYKEGVYAVVGLHPTSVMEEEFNKEEFEKLVAHPKTVGVGECGIDVFRPAEKYKTEEGIVELLKKQEEVFKVQIELAVKYDKPIMIHARQSYGKILEIFERDFISKGVKLRGNAHFFAGTIEEAQAFINIGFTVSFTGVITFAKEYEKLVEAIPLTNILSETDCPYVTPVPFRGKRNEPLYVSEVVKKIAEIKGLDLEVVKQTLISNAFFQFFY